MAANWDGRQREMASLTNKYLSRPVLLLDISTQILILERNDHVVVGTSVDRSRKFLKFFIEQLCNPDLSPGKACSHFLSNG
jgi:hypothetical protein